MKCVRHATCTGEKGNAFRWENLKERDNVNGLGIDGRTVLN
jgi:hypothetical protein